MGRLASSPPWQQGSDCSLAAWAIARAGTEDHTSGTIETMLRRGTAPRPGCHPGSTDREDRPIRRVRGPAAGGSEGM
eukprot:10035006-Alexandrium_andersonii.AAC.1